MSGINLLPWRDWERERRRRRFVFELVGAGMAGIAVAAVSGWLIDGATAQQSSRNAYLTERTAEVEERIAQAMALREREAQLVSRLTEFEQLLARRPTVAGILNALPQTLADGLHFTSMTRTDNSVTLHGAAVSVGRISTLMRNMEHASVFTAPGLKQVEERLPPAPYRPGAVDFELALSLVERDAATNEHLGTGHDLPAVAMGNGDDALGR